MTPAYETGPRDGWQRPPSDLHVGVVALVTVTAVWCGWSVWLPVVAGLGVWLLRVLGAPATACVALACLVPIGGGASTRAWRDAVPRTVGAFDGWGRLRSDPTPLGGGVSVVLELDGERFQAVVYGSARRRLDARQAGEWVRVEGRRRPLGDGDRWLQVRHVVGRFEVDRIGDHRAGAPIDRAANRVRARLRSAAEASMSADDAALFTGLVVGDDARESAEVVDRFRAVGLSHLTAVSGQNVSFAIAAAGVVLRRLRPWWRLGATWALIAWFVVLTRAEPSVLRAGSMAALGAWAFALGRDRSVPRLLALAAVGLVLVDPLLVWSVAFWLSCGATLGVSVIGPVLVDRWRGPQWLAEPVGIAVGAQLGVAVPSVLVFGRLPALGVPANLLAVPVAGLVMLVGIPAALVASALPPVVGRIVMLPSSIGTHWVATVAAITERLAPRGPAVVVVWVVQLGLAAWCWRPRRVRACDPAGMMGAA
ncbi:MAG: ComEC/Rec2 family competence protein [Acidimicrobiales bacterium]